MTARPTFLLVHGAWHGGWSWARVRPLLLAQGARVLSPTLTGQGERAHLREPVPSLETHALDIQGVIEAEELQDVILVGHSYGGMVTTLIADRLKSRIRRLVYLDAAVPSDGDDFAAHAPGSDPALVERKRAAFRSMAPDGAWLPVVGPEMVGVTNPDDGAWVTRRSTPHPLRTWLDPVKFANGGHAGLPKTYVLATDPVTPFMGYAAHGEIAKGGGEWTYREIPTGHSMMVTDPARTAELLLEAARD
ncbi:MAG: alpha/beta hydrolase [Caulobacterales bacterium]|nr:alpha/beta hydrolase [Caulobacterales bacterium]